MRVNLGPLLKVITFVVTMGFLISMVGIVFGRVRLEPSSTYDAVFTDASGLSVSSDVRGNGVSIGVVKDVNLRKDGKVSVTFTVNKTVELTQTTEARIRYANLTGDRFIDLTQGDPASGRLHAGSTIPVGRTQPALDLDDFFRGFDPLMQALDPAEVNQLASNLLSVTQGQAGAVEAMLANVGSFTSRLADRDEVIGDTVVNLSKALTVVDSQRGNFTDLITRLEALMAGLAKDRRVIGASLSSINDAAAQTGDLLARVRPGVKSNIDEMGRIARNLNSREAFLRSVLDEYPEMLGKLMRTGSYGSVFNLFLCGVRVKIDMPGKSLDVYTPMVETTDGRCGGKVK